MQAVQGTASVLNMQQFLEEQAQDFASKFPSESFESPKASSSPFKKTLIDKLLQKKLSPSMGGLYKLQNQSIKSLALQKKENEYMNTPEKKEKYKVLSKQMATKLAFKNLKQTLFKQQDWQEKPNYSQNESTEASEGEQATTPQAADSPSPTAPIMLAKDADPSQRTLLYLTSFERISFEWDKTCISQHLELHLSVPQMCAEIELTQSGKVCRATNQEHCFKTAFGTEVLLPSHRYYFEFKCVRGTNFKFGIATEQARANPNMAFCDDKHGYAYFSTGALRHASKGMGPSYGEKFKQDDIIGVYVDLADGVVFYAKNGAVVAKNAFEGAALQGRKFYPAACCLTKNEMFELLEPAVED